MNRLQIVYQKAIERILTKGQERHGTDGDQSFDAQPIFQIPQQLKADESPFLYQAVKKIYESRRLKYPANENELLDAIVYLMCAVIHLGEMSYGDSC